MEREAYIQIFHTYRRRLCNFLYYKCGNMAYAEDIVQEVFVVLWEKRSAIKSENIKSFLYIVANNLYIDHYRHTKINLHVKLNYSGITPESPDYIMEQKEFNNKLQAAIASLSEKERVVFLMNRIDGLTFKEIAESLNISVKAIEKRMQNAVEKLHKKINHKL